MGVEAIFCHALAPAHPGYQVGVRAVRAPSESGTTPGNGRKNTSQEPPREPEMQINGPLSLSLSPSKGERVPKAGEGAVQDFNARIPLENSLPYQPGSGLAVAFNPFGPTT
jgi:hypothetical protein